MDKNKGINIEALMAWKEKQELINGYIRRGEEIPEELTRTFVTVPLKDDPYSEIE